MIDFTNPPLAKWTNSPFGARAFESQRDAFAAAASLDLRDDITSIRVEQYVEEIISEER